MDLDAKKPLKILIVEDDLVDKKLLERLLSKSRLSVSEIKHSNLLDDALALLEKEHFDVILSDLNLPDSDSFRTLTEISKMNHDGAVIIITGESDEELGLKAISVGAHEYLVKGRFDVYALTKSIEYALERKKTERKLKLAEEKYRTIFENSAVAIMLVDEHERIISWNKFSEGLLGMTSEDLYHKSVKELYPLEEWEAIRNYNVRQRGMQHHLETKMIKKTGELIDVDISLSVQRNPEGQVIGSIGVVSDITERKRHQEILNRKQRNLETIFDAAPVGMLLIDEDLVVRRVNEVIRQMVHKDFKDIVNKPFGSILGCMNTAWGKKGCGYTPACRLCTLKTTIEKVLSTKEPVHKAVMHATLLIDDKEVSPWFCISAEIVEIDNEEFVVAAFEDITELKRAEEELKETMEMKSQFISTVSHELRTPLASMRESVSIVLDESAGKTNNEQKHFLGIAIRNIDRLSRLINDVLDFQKLGAGKMKFDMQQNDIRQVVLEAHNTMTSYANRKGVDFSLEFDGDLPKARFDSDRIVQVITNLTSNAIKFTPENGKVNIFVKRQNQHWSISVTDTGMGIPKEDLPRIFDRFYRVRRPGKEIRGTGLGLAIVNQIVKAHGGTIEVQSELNKGTTFNVLLPLSAEPPLETQPEEADEILEETFTEN